MRKSYLAASSVFLLLFACTTAKKRGLDYLNAGDYDDAVRQLELAVAASPGDAEAVMALRKAREGWLDRHLISVRMARLAGNQAQAIDLLLNVCQNEASWGISPGSTVSFTQDEETGYAGAFLKAKVSADLNANHPLAIENDLHKYKPILSGKYAGTYDSLKAQTLNKGKQECNAFRSQEAKGKPYFTRFVAKFCEHFGVSYSDPNADSDAGEFPYYNGVQLTGSVDGLTPDQLALLTDSMSQAFKQSAWYDADGSRTLQIPLSGKFVSTRTRNPIPMTQTYAVQEPYTVIVPVTKQRQVPVIVKTMVQDPTAPGGVRETDTTQYQTENYTDNESQVAYHSVQKEYHFVGYKATQHLELALSSHFLVSQKPLDLALSDHSDSEGVEHDENQPSMNLKPVTANLPDPIGWLKQEGQAFAGNFGAKAAQLWKDEYCSGATRVQSPADLGNQVQMCLRQQGAQIPPFADEWYRSQLGVGVAEASGILGD